MDGEVLLKMSMPEYRLYRCQSKKHRYKPFVPSAFRENCISYMKNKVSQYGIDVQCYKQKCIPNRMLANYCNNEYRPPKEAFYIYWLSLMNCSIAVNNTICYNFCKAPFFTKNKDIDVLVYINYL